MRSDEGRLVKPGLRGERDGDSGERGSVEAEGTMGKRESVATVGAEDEADEASAKANRKEADEPEREMAEKSAMSSRKINHTGSLGDGNPDGDDCPYEGTIGMGQRVTKATGTL